MRIEFWIDKTTDMYLEFIILFAFSLQRWLHERTSVLLCSTLLVLFKLNAIYVYTGGAKKCIHILRDIIYVLLFEV